MSKRLYTSKQMGDACEMLVAAEMTLAGMPAMKMPDNWPGYDVVAQPTAGGPPQRISVKSRTFTRGGGSFVEYDGTQGFDWLAVVLLPGDGEPRRRIFIAPKHEADIRGGRPNSKYPYWVYWRQDRLAASLAEFEDNFCLSLTGRTPLTFEDGK